MRNVLMLLSAILTASFLLAAAGCDSSELKTPQEAVVLNQTGGAIYFELFHVDSQRPEKFSFFIDLRDPPSDLVAEGDTAIMESVFAEGDTTILKSACTAPKSLSKLELLLYDIEETPKSDTVEAVIARRMPPGKIMDQLRENNCQIVVDSRS